MANPLPPLTSAFSQLSFIEDRADFHEFENEDNHFDDLCAICDNGGILLRCEGRCMRSFHATPEDGEESNGEELKCASLGFTRAQVMGMEEFYCKNCEYEQHQCFACGELGSSDESSADVEVFCCVNGDCGHFYHPYCVAKLLHPNNEAAAENHREQIAAGEEFSCPLHKCHVCNELEFSPVLDFQFAVCRRCPRAYHRICLPREIAFENEVDENIVPRAWEGLIRNRVLIYCLEHEMDAHLGTPVRNHALFPGQQ